MSAEVQSAKGAELPDGPSSRGDRAEARLLEPVATDNAEDRECAAQAVAVFARQYGAKFPKAVKKIVEDEDELLAFYDYHLRTTNRSWAVSRSESRLTGTPRTVLGALVLRFRVPVGDAYPVCGPSRAGGIPTTWPYGCGRRRRGGPEPSRW
ncbi:hypothetical protein OH809_42520 [Streptomyces sp. NBC_00873]|uniref:hypothetical protein n=1 Tax=Streptomyces sp. NBC_00873 TaxID=2975852 RepID=UPI0038671B29|nr:hypothetical protein OH809_01190 [Streptomyces sp. NBC_00873]WSY97452.1 hypothetical protein OH809_42520 [Streptomyces sp. NBC_00873]